MSLMNTVDADIREALLGGHADTLRALRALKAALLLLKTEKDGSDEISPEDEIKLLQKQIKQRKESSQIYSEQQREDLAVIERQEIAVMEKYLPSQWSRDQIETVVGAIVKRENAVTIKDLGKVIQAASKELAGKTDNKTISEIAKQFLS